MRSCPYSRSRTMFGCAMDLSSAAPRSKSAAKPGRDGDPVVDQLDGDEMLAARNPRKFVLGLVDRAEPAAAEARAQAIPAFGQAFRRRVVESSAPGGSAGPPERPPTASASPGACARTGAGSGSGRTFSCPRNMPLDSQAVPSFMLAFGPETADSAASPFGDGRRVSVRLTPARLFSRGSARSGGTGPPGRRGRSASRAGRSRA